MSNPLYNLRKSRKAPFPAARANGIKLPMTVRPESSRSNISGVSDASLSDESRLLDEITTNMATERFKDLPPDGHLPRLHDGSPSTSGSSSPKSNSMVKGSGDKELLSMMMARLAQLEQKLKHQSKELTDKDKRNRILEDKVRIIMKARDACAPDKVHDLERKCYRLQCHVHEMEAFLEDYGMVWVGESDNDALDRDMVDLLGTEEDNSDDDTLTMSQVQNKLWRPDSAVPSEFKVDYDLILKNIDELNQLANDGVSHIQKTADGARLKKQDPLNLTLYANGIMMFSGPFRPFSDTSTQQCMKDIMDGYFPAELQSRFPDGIPFKVRDRRSVVFKDRLSKVFEGHADLLGGETKPSRLVPTNLEKASQASELTEKQETSQLPGPQLSMEQFLQRLPASVVKDGKVIDVRSSVGSKLTGNKGASGVTVVETDALKAMKSRLEQENPPPGARDLTTLRVKNESGEHTFVLKMKYSDTIRGVHQQLSKHRTKGSAPFQLMSTFPRQTYTDMDKTLEEYELVPNATLHMKPVQK